MIVINARFLTQPITGVQRVGIEWSKQLKKLREDLVFVTPKNIIHNELAQELDAKVIGTLKGHLWEHIDLYRYVISNSKPLLISFGFTGPLFYKNQVITVYDIGFKIHPEWFSFSFRTLYNMLVPRLVSKSRLVLTDSYAVKNEIIKSYKVHAEKVQAVHLGIADIFLSDNYESNLELNNRYILTVSSHHPRKNFKRLIKAFNLLDDNNLYLYIIGSKVSHFNDDLEISDNPRVKFLTGITDQELVQYYRNAELFIFASLYEGFGLPIIEAMSQGVTCVISDIPVFREICGDKVEYFDPLSIESISYALGSRIKSRLTDDMLSQNAISIRENFTWMKGAKTINKLINNLSE